MAGDWQLPRVQTGFTYRGIEAVFLENDALRILVLPGKGGDVLEFRDKRAGADVLYHTDHNWQPPADRRVPTDDRTAWQDTYPGGWQVNLPVAGYADGFGGAPYGLHGETALLDWEATVARDDEDGVALRLETDLVRYPLAVERELSLPAGEATLRVEETVENVGGVGVEYIYQQHLALGTPLVGPGARVDIPATTGVLDPDPAPNARHPADERFDWPAAPRSGGGEVDFSRPPGRDAGSHDMAYATDLDAGWYAVTNPDIDLGFAFAFPTDPFECVWYWGAFGGVETAPFFNRNYNLGLEPTSAYPGGDIPGAQRENGTLKRLAPGEAITSEFAATTYRGLDAVDRVTPDGEVHG